MLRQVPKLLGKCESDKVFQNIPQSPASRGASCKCVYYAGTWLLNWDFMVTSANMKCNKLPSLVSSKYVSWHSFCPATYEPGLSQFWRPGKLNGWQKLIHGLNKWTAFHVWTQPRTKGSVTAEIGVHKVVLTVCKRHLKAMTTAVLKWFWESHQNMSK